MGKGCLSGKEEAQGEKQSEKAGIFHGFLRENYKKEGGPQRTLRRMVFLAISAQQIARRLHFTTVSVLYPRSKNIRIHAWSFSQTATEKLVSDGEKKENRNLCWYDKTII